jgi:RNA polymerase sigma-32 factor
MSSIVIRAESNQYITHIKSFPDLSKDEEYSLANRYIANNDLFAAEKLVIHNLKNIIPIASLFKGYNLPLIDLIQEGSIGLMKAVKKFNPIHGVRLMTFASYYIKAELCDYILNNVHIMKIATTKPQQKLFFNLKSLKKNNLPITIEDANKIADQLNVKVEDVIEMDVRLSTKIESMHQSIDDEETEVDVPDFDSNPESVVMVEDHELNILRNVRDALDKFNDRERFVIQKRLIDEEKMTLKEIAAELGVSHQRVDEIYRTAVKKLRSQLSHLVA